MVFTLYLPIAIIALSEHQPPPVNLLDRLRENLVILS